MIDSKRKNERTEEQFVEGNRHVLLPLRQFLTEDSISRAKQRLQTKHESMKIDPIQSLEVNTFLIDQLLPWPLLMKTLLLLGLLVEIYQNGQLSNSNGLWTTRVGWNVSIVYKGLVIQGLQFLARKAEIDIYSLEDKAPVASLSGHEGRVPRLALHPSGKFLASASYDMSWRLWDISKGMEVQKQMAHHNPVYGLAFHPDGGLLGTSSLDALARIWDCRTGRCIWTLEQGGHADAILSIDFCPDGRQICTAGQDNGVRIWDLRKLGHAVFNIPAHSSTVTQTKFLDHCTLASCSFDRTIKIWSISTDWKVIETLEGHEGKVFCHR